MTLEEKKEQLKEELMIIEDPYERFAYVIDFGKQNQLDDKYKIDAFKVEGCVSNLWLVPEFKEGKCYFKSDGDSQITKGIAALLSDFYSGYTPDEILAVGPEFLAEAGITQHLSSNRRNGLSQLTKKLTSFAESCQKELKTGN